MSSFFGSALKAASEAAAPLVSSASNAAAAAKQSAVDAANKRIATMDNPRLYKTQSENLTSLFLCTYQDSYCK